MINVVHVVNTLAADFGGPSRSVPALCESLAREGAGVRIVTSDTRASHGIAVVPNPELVRTVTVPSLSSSRLRMVWSPTFGRVLAGEVGPGGASLLHVHGLWAASLHRSCVIARRLRLPYVLSPRGMVSPWALGHKRWKKELAWRGYQRRDLEGAAVLHATARQEAGDLRALGFRQPIAVIPNAVELPTDPPKRPERAPVKTALFLSRVHPQKGLINLVQAWAQVRPSGWRLHIAGPNEENFKPELEREIARLGIGSDVKWSAAVHGDEKWALFGAADLFLLPSFTENFGMVVVEALASGVPVITTRAAPWAELTEHRCGWWIQVGVAPLAEALREATAMDDGERRAMGARGRALVSSRYTWSSVASEMLALYEWILRGGARPASVETL
jgi:glycosyltransferase involved in cell wall biosynthesis